MSLLNRHGVQRRWRNREVSRERDPASRRWMAGVLFFTAVALIPSAATPLQQNQCLTLTYQIDALKREEALLLEERRRLREKLTRLRSLESVDAWARKKGLVGNDAHETVVVRFATAPPAGLVATTAPANTSGDSRRR